MRRRSVLVAVVFILGAAAGQIFAVVPSAGCLGGACGPDVPLPLPGTYEVVDADDERLIGATVVYEVGELRIQFTLDGVSYEQPYDLEE